MLVLLAVALNGLVLPRAPSPMMLLGSDGLPMKKGGGGAPATPPVAAPPQNADDGIAGGPPIQDVGPSEKVLGTFSMPDDLANFDPTYDPLAAERPKYDLAAASGRPDEVVYGAKAAESAAELGEWAAHMKDKMGATRMLGLFTAEAAGARSAAGTPEGYFNELLAAGPFEADRVGLIDMRSVGAREAVLQVMRDTQKARERVCIHCADGHANTAIVLADWLCAPFLTTATTALTALTTTTAPNPATHGGRGPPTCAGCLTTLAARTTRRRVTLSPRASGSQGWSAARTQRRSRHGWWRDTCEDK